MNTRLVVVSLPVKAMAESKPSNRGYFSKRIVDQEAYPSRLE
jgi:hypothetical protein